MPELFRSPRVQVATALLMLMAAVPASADSIPGLFGTGVLNDGTAAPAGSVDLHYQLISSADSTYPGPNAIVADPIAGGYWLANSSSSQWIGPAQNQGYPGAVSHAGGDYVYRISFDLTGLDPTSAVVTGSWAADNKGIKILLNGNDTGNGTPEPGYSAYTLFTLSSGFVAGVNTLDFVVYNIPDPNSNPTGLRVDNLSGTASPIPIPAAAWLLGSGLLGLAGFARRRPAA